MIFFSFLTSLIPPKLTILCVDLDFLGEETYSQLSQQHVIFYLFIYFKLRDVGEILYNSLNNMLNLFLEVRMLPLNKYPMNDKQRNLLA